MRLLTLALLGLAACVEADERSTYWPALHSTIIEPSCATVACHSKVTSQGGVNLSTPDHAYAMLTGRLCVDETPPGQAPGNFVFPGDPERSKLLHMLEGDYVVRMPPDTPLARAEIELIRRWIEEGAPCD